MVGIVLATAGYDHTIRFWEAGNGACNRTVQYPDSQVNCLEITSDKNYIMATGNPHIKLYEINSNNPNPVMNYDGHSSNVTSAGFQKQNKWMYSGSEDGTIKIWDLRIASHQRNYDIRSPITCVVLHPNQGELICVDQNGSFHIYDLTADKCSYKSAPDGEHALRSVCISNDASFCIASNNIGNCFIYTSKPTGYELTKTIKAHDTYITKCKISYNNKYLVTCSADKTAKIWNTIDYSLNKTLIGHQRWVWDCAFSSTSSYLVTASSDQFARLWDIETGESIRQYAGHHKAIVSIALNDISE